MTGEPEVVVVGAGPGGSACAYYLATLGRRVLLLDKATFPRDKSCGDGLTRSACRLLDEMGVDLGPSAQRVVGVKVVMRERGERDFLYPEDLPPPRSGLVVPRLDLDAVLCAKAVAAGAQLMEGAAARSLVTDGARVAGVRVRTASGEVDVRAPFVVAADGATSRLARQAGLVRVADDRMGVAIRGYYEAIDDAGDLLEIYLPLMDVTDRYLLPSYGWLFPTGGGRANVGVGVFERQHGVNVRELMARFVDELRDRRRGFAPASASGEWRAAPLRFDFAPDRCSAPGLLLVGDAAGMISPFTGEGISYALESGKLAAEVVHRELTEPTSGLAEYGRRLGAKYSGYFETGRRSARKYHLIWRVLDSTFHNDKPLFDVCRHAVLFPEGVGDSITSAFLDDVTALVPGLERRLRSDMVQVGQILADVAREDWPFLTRMSMLHLEDRSIPFRPALLLLLGAYLGDERTIATEIVAASVELGFAGAMAQVSVHDDSVSADAPLGERRANWGNVFAVMVGDFLFAKAYDMTADVGGAISGVIADALAATCEVQALTFRNAYDPDLGEREYLQTLAGRVGAVFELPCRLGGLLGGADAGTVADLARYGRELGIAFQLADEALQVDGEPSRLARAMGARLEDGVYSLPVLRAVRDERVGPELRALLREGVADEQAADAVYALVRATGAGAGVRDLAGLHARRARSALATTPDGRVKDALGRLADYAVTRTHDAL